MYDEIVQAFYNDITKNMFHRSHAIQLINIPFLNFNRHFFKKKNPSVLCTSCLQNIKFAKRLYIKTTFDTRMRI